MAREFQNDFMAMTAIACKGDAGLSPAVLLGATNGLVAASHAWGW